MNGPRPRAREKAAGSTDALRTKAEELRDLLCALGPVLVAYSGGVDSTTLLHAALEVLGADSVLAVTAQGDVHTDEELGAARAAAARMGARHLILRTQELEILGFSDNPPERCYLCKRALFTRLNGIAADDHMKTVVDGSNADDLSDYRPGRKASEEFGVRSPLAAVGLSKSEVRALAREWGLSEWDRPSSPCLASRFPYGEQITHDGLRMVAEAERYLHGLGFEAVRVRHHGDMARIEVGPVGMALLLGSEDSSSEAAASTRHAIVEHLRRLGYTYVALDLQGFRSGSLNEALGSETAQREEQ